MRCNRGSSSSHPESHRPDRRHRTGIRRPVARVRRRRGRIQRDGRRRRRPSRRGARRRPDGRRRCRRAGLARSAFATGRLAFSTSAEAVAESSPGVRLRADAAARRDARPLVHRACLRGRRRAAGSRIARGARVDDVSGHHRRAGQAAARDVGAHGRARLPAGVLAGADRPRQRGVHVPRGAARGRWDERRSPRASRSCSTSSSSTRSWPCRPAARPSSRSCWRTRSAT